MDGFVAVARRNDGKSATEPGVIMLLAWLVIRRDLNCFDA
jgi:hypothetical protein